MEQFDQFFNKKFQERQFELNQEHWLEAEKLIIAQEKKKRRRWLFFWFFGSLTGLAVIGLLWFTLGNSYENSIENTAQKNNKPLPNENNLIIETPETKAKTIDQLTSNTPEEGDEVPVDATNSASLKTKTTSISNAGKNSNLPSSTFKSEVDQVITNTSSNQPINSDKQFSKSTTQDPINQSTNQPINLATDSLAQAMEEEETPSKEDANLELTKLSLDGIALLEYDVDHSIGNYLPDERKDIQKETKNIPFLSADFNISAYPYFSSETKPILGFKAGLSWGKPLNQQFTLVSAINYEFRGGTFDTYKESNRVAYRFSKAEERFILVPENLHYAEAASLLSWKKGNNIFEAGAGLNYLLGIRGELRRFTSDDNFETSTTEGKGWLVEDGFKKWHVKAMLGYSHRFSSKLGLGIRLNYAIGTILDKNYQYSEVFLKENQPLTLDLRFRYYFF